MCNGTQSQGVSSFGISTIKMSQDLRLVKEVLRLSLKVSKLSLGSTQLLMSGLA